MALRVDVRYLGGVANGINLTGSCIYLKIRRGKKITRLLVDAGLLQCEFKNSIKKNEEMLTQIDPAKVNCLILTHSHIDHSGRLPFLVKKGFVGKVFTTKPTSALLRAMLPDSANIQESEANYLNRKRKKAERNNGKEISAKKQRKRKKGKEKEKKEAIYCLDIEPLYSMKDVEKSYQLIKNDGFDYGIWIKLETGIGLKFFPSGHVLGGAICLLRIKEMDSSEYVYFGFSGDLGREDGIILPPPEKINVPVDYWFVESTYGDRIHPERDSEIKKMLELVNEVAQKKKIMIIPSFALERVQEILYLLSYHMHAGNVAKLPIYLDSPLALQITKVYSEYWRTKMFKDQDILPFNPFDISENPYLKISVSREESTELSKSTGPHIVIAGSGMCDAGRVRNHLRENLSNSNAIVSLVGFMADGSLGAKLRDGFPLVKMNGQEITVKAKIVIFGSLSAHADSLFLPVYTKSIIRMGGSRKPKIVIGHGSEKGGLTLKRNLTENLKPLGWSGEIIIPNLNQVISI